MTKTIAQLLADMEACNDRIGARANEMGDRYITADAWQLEQDLNTLKQLLKPSDDTTANKGETA